MEIVAIVLAALLGAAVVALAAVLLANARLARARERMRAEALDALRVQFAATASEELAARTRSLSRQNREEVAAVAGGLRDELLRGMAELRRATEEAVRANTEIGAEMKSGVSGVRASAELLGRKAEGLEKALAGGGKIQGIWGEAVLARVFENAGLRKGVDYFLQKGSEGAGIPDAEVIDPAGRVLIVDSKTSLTAFLAACNEEDPARRKRLLGEHVKSVKKHIQELSEKDYVTRRQRDNPGRTYIRQVAMFVPSEAAHAAAMAEDPTLGDFAAEHGVALATPLTLQSYLRLVAQAWQQEAATRGQREIVAKAELMLKRVDVFLAALDELGAEMDKARATFDRAAGLVGRREGAQSLVTPARELLALGVKLGRPHSRALSTPDDAAFPPP